MAGPGTRRMIFNYLPRPDLRDVGVLGSDYGGCSPLLLPPGLPPTKQDRVII